MRLALAVMTIADRYSLRLMIRNNTILLCGLVLNVLFLRLSGLLAAEQGFTIMNSILDICLALVCWAVAFLVVYMFLSVRKADREIAEQQDKFLSAKRRKDEEQSKSWKRNYEALQRRKSFYVVKGGKYEENRNSDSDSRSSDSGHSGSGSSG